MERLKFNVMVLAVTASSERPVYMAIDTRAGCEMAATRNRSPHTILYIVVLPDGSRLSISEQREYLKNN